MARFELRVGTDIASFEEVSGSIAQFGSRYTERLFTDQEVKSSGGVGATAVPGLTARFAAKEAFIKVLRTADLIPAWNTIEVVRQPGGWTDLRLHGAAAAMAAEAGLSRFAVSLSHSAGFGIATVIAVSTSGASTSSPDSDD